MSRARTTLSKAERAALTAALPEFAPAPKPTGPSATEEAWLGGYEEIAAWVAAQGRLPEDHEGVDFLERRFAVRRQVLCRDEAARAFLASEDAALGLLTDTPDVAAFVDAAASHALTETGEIPADSIRELRHVPPSEELRRGAPDYIAQRELCPDFVLYEALFKQVQRDLKSGARVATEVKVNPSVAQADLFILDGQLVYVAAVSEEFLGSSKRFDARLRVIYSSGTQSKLLRRSLQKALTHDKTSRRVQSLHGDPLLEWAAAQKSSEAESETEAAPAAKKSLKSGTLYVLRSLSSHPYITANRARVHKIGMTKGEVEERIAGAEESPTYLFAPVEIAATYTLEALDPLKTEALLHRLFAPAQIDIKLPDRFGKAIKPKEWFLVPRKVIDEAVQRISDGSITDYRYDKETEQLVRG